MRVGILGGTFDPIHLGHLILAEQCRDQAKLDQVWFLPSYHPPHKSAVAITRFEQRCDMLELATAGHPSFCIERIEKEGVRTVDGQLHELDVLVLATGFRVDRFMRPIEVVGRGGVSLDTVWAKRPSAYLSISIPEFPNLFMLNGPNGPVGNFSLIDVAELQFGYIMQLIDGLAGGRWREVSAKREAMEEFEAARVEAAQNTVWVTGCRSWYLDDRGIPAVWPWTFDRFREEMAGPKLDHYELVG